MSITTHVKASVVALSLALAVSACGDEREAASADAATDAPGEPVALTITNFAYEPQALKVSAGDRVRWTNEDMFAHTVTDVEARDGDGRFDGELGTLDEVDAQGTTFERTFTEPGTYTYFCRFHPDMRGSVVVTTG